MTQGPGTNYEESPLDLDDLQAIEESLILSYLDEEKQSPDGIDENITGELFVKVSLARARLEIENNIEEIEQKIHKENKDSGIDEEDMRKRAEVKMIQLTAHQVMEYFILASALIETLSIDLLKKEVITDEYSDSTKTDTILESRMVQETREDLLLRTGTIDESLKSELTHVRTVRNKLVHDVSDHIFLEWIDNIPTELDRAYDAYSQLFDKIADDIVSLEVTLDSE